MTRLEAALLEMVALLEELGFQYMLIGGLAVAQWGEPRATLDVDLSVWVDPDHVENAVSVFEQRLTLRTARPLEVVRSSKVLPVTASNGVLVDLLFAAWPMERQAIENATELRVAGKLVRVAALDDLLLLKLISDRPKDLADAAALLRRHRATANIARLEQELAALADSIAEPEKVERFRRMIEGFSTDV